MGLQNVFEKSAKIVWQLQYFVWKYFENGEVTQSNRIDIILLPKSSRFRWKLKKSVFSDFLGCFRAFLGIFLHGTTKDFPKKCQKSFGNCKILFESTLRMEKSLKAIALILSCCQNILAYVENWKNRLFRGFRLF